MCVLVCVLAFAWVYIHVHEYTCMCMYACNVSPSICEQKDGERYFLSVLQDRTAECMMMIEKTKLE